MINFSQVKTRYLLLLTVLLMAMFSYWLYTKMRAYQALEAVPSQAALVMTFPNPGEISFDSKRSTPLSDLSIYQVMRRDIDLALDLFRQDSSQPEQIKTKAVVAGFSLHPTDSLHPVFIFDVGFKISENQLLSRFKTAYKKSTSNFKGHTLHSIRLPNAEPTIFAISRNLLIISRFSYLVEDALLQLDEQERWWANHASNLEAQHQICFRTEVLAERCKAVFKSPWEALPSWFSERVAYLSFYRLGQDWKIDIQYKNELPALLDNNWHADALASVLPDNTAFVAWATLENLSFFKDKMPENEATVDFQKYIQPWAGTEVAYVLREPYSQGMQQDQFLILSIRDEVLAKQKMNAYGDQTGLLKTYEYQTFEIRQYLNSAFLSPLLNSDMMAFVNPVCISINGYMVFAASTSAMELFVDKYIVNQTLFSSPDFLYLIQKSKPVGSSWFYFNSGYAQQIVKEVIHEGLFFLNKNDIEILSKNNLFAANLINESKTNLQGKIAKQVQIKQDLGVNILWKTEIGSAAYTQPFVIPGNSLESEAAILIQDDKMLLYRLNMNGTILWRKQLNLPIQSAVLGIDYYNNGAINFAFNTANAIWVLDDEGQAISGFPLNLQSPATNGLTIVDFDGDKQYSLFLACQNGNLYGFDQFGRPLSGWNPKPQVGRIKHPLIHFKHGTKDYLAVLSMSGQLSVFNRNSTEHFEPRQFEGSFFVSPPQFDAESEAPRIVCANSAGRTFVCNLTGQTFALELGPKKGESEACLVFEQLFGDSRKDYACLSGNTVSIFGYTDKDFKKAHDLAFPAPLDTLFWAGSGTQVGGLNRAKRQIFLIDGGGKLYPGFPLAGSTPFTLNTISSNSKQTSMLLTGNRNAVCAYKIE